MGKMLFVDLTSGTIREEEVSEELAQNFIGGYGFGAKILYDMMNPGVDPLGADNILGFITGPATGTGAFFGSRWTLVHKSPVTGGWNDANSGGFFGPELKKAGYDALFVTGAAKEPVYIWINDGKVEIRDAKHLWGKDCKDTLPLLAEETGEPKMRAAVIGPAGERLSLISCPINDGHRAPGRGGGGAVMGSKKLKAVAVRGTGTVPVANPDKIKEINRKVTTNMKNGPMAAMVGGFGAYGTGVGTPASALNGDSPIKNWDGVGVFDIGEEKANNLSTVLLDGKYKIKPYGCFGCPLACGAEYKVDAGRWPLEQTERPEYETLASFGGMLLVDDADAIMKCNEICNRNGLDTISAGCTVSWAMECYNKGVLTKEDLDGIELTWGNAEAVVAITEKIAAVEGCGKILAQGTEAAAEIWGKGAEFLQNASGIELPMHDSRFAPGLARTYQYDPTPGRHVKGGIGMAQLLGAPVGYKYNYNATGFLDTVLTTNQEILNCSGFCLFLGFAAPPEAQNEYIEAVTGMTFKDQHSLVTGIRILNMRHAFNLREGLKPADFNISQRAIGKPPQTKGPVANATVDTDKLGKNFFNMIGWDWETGKPTLGSLEKLGGLESVIKDLY
jgi:aldehyde:ferredoxin oxidoreductase